MTEVDIALAAIGSRMECPEDWIAVAMACLDQADVSLEDQERVRVLLSRGRHAAAYGRKAGA